MQRWVLGALLGVALFVRLGSEPVWRASERRCLAVVTEMVRDGDWLVPHMDGAPRLAKPPLFYWTAGPLALASGDRSVLPLRVASVLAALGLAAVVYAVGRSLAGSRAGLASAAALATSALFVVRARTGDAEMLLALLSFSALVVFERLERTRDPRLLPALAALVALAFLTKATAALVNVLVPIALWLWLRGELRLALRPRVLGWVLASAAAGSAWYAYILWRVPGAARELLSIAVLPIGIESGLGSEHYRGPWHYAVRFPIQTLPASLLLFGVIADAARTRFWRGESRERFLATSALAQLAAWSLVPQKQMHYLLPLVPLQAVLCGLAVARRLARKAEVGVARARHPSAS